MVRLFGGMVLALALALPARAEEPLTPLRPLPAGGGNGVQGVGEADPAAVAPAPAAAARRAGPAVASGGVKPGRWQFASQLQGSAAGGPVPANGGPPVAYTSCIRADNVLPAEFGAQCTLDSSEHEGARVKWSMSCASSRARIDGVAHYDGDAMTATVVSRLTGPDGKLAEMTQHITGRYLGPCTVAAADETGEAPTAAAPESIGAAADGSPAGPVDAASLPTAGIAGSPQGESIEPPAAAATSLAPDAVSPPEAARPPRHAVRRRYAWHRRRHFRHYGYAVWPSGRLGPAPDSASGP